MTDMIRFYWYLLLRRSPAMIALVVIALVAAAGYALNQPNRYQATAKLLLEDPQIPDELAASTVNTDSTEYLSIIQGRMMRRANLIEIANKYGVFDDSETVLTPTEINNLMREATSIEIAARRNQANFIDITFEASDPQKAADVVNEYVTRILEDNMRIRTERAGNTLEFFEQEVDRLSGELAIQSGRISEFKAENSNTLPDSLNFRLNRETALEERVLSLKRELAALNEQRDRVISVFEETGRLRRPEADLTPEERQLRDLESQLSSALAVYSDTNPRVTVLRTRIEQLRKVIEGRGSEDQAEGPAASVYEITLAEIDAREASISAQIADAESELEALRRLIERTPQTAIALEALDRDYRNVQTQYDGAVARLARARTGEQIELTAQGQRITVVENAVASQYPTSPNRKMIAAAGGLAGLAAAAGLFALLELLNTTIRRPAELVSRLGVKPLATIPYIPTRRERVLRRTVQISALLLFFIVAPAALYIIDSYYMPLTEVVERAKDVIRGTAG